jgi:signal transduction histidine kinase
VWVDWEDIRKSADWRATHGGTLEIVSPKGQGTRIEVAIPCGS